MSPVVAIIAPGAMGSAVARRLTENGARVLTSLDGRSRASAARAQDCGMIPVSDEAIAGEAAMILSIVPPAEAVATAQRFGAVLPREGGPVYVDCNAIDPGTVERVRAALSPSGVDFVDGALIGGPPVPGEAGPTLYLSGPAAVRVMPLGRLGLALRVLDGPIGAASALKMSYAGITKGLTAIAAAMVLAADRAGAGEALRDELAASQPQLLARLTRALPDMLPKAYRWVAEMREIATFVGEDRPEAAIYEGAAGLYARLAAGAEGDAAELDVLRAFCAGAGAAPPGGARTVK